MQEKPYTVRVTSEEAGQRIDNFLLRRAGGVPRSHVYQLIRKGRALVDGRRVKPARKLQLGEQVRVPAMHRPVSGSVRVPDAMAETLAAAVRVETEHWLLLAKPAGVAVHGGTGIAFGVIDALRQARDEPSLELVHRLDRDTSGALLIGRGLAATRELQDLFRERRIDKRYEALVAGAWPASLDRIDVPLEVNVEQAGERRVVVSSSGLEALTHFAVQERFDASVLGLALTRLEVDLETGRTHQIRVHASHAGHAIIGDRRYGDNRVNTRCRRAGLERLFLHARRLHFEWRGERHALEVPTDEKWQHSLEGLRR